MHLRRIAKSGIPWVRMEVTKPYSGCKRVFSEAKGLDLNVIAVVISRKMLREQGLGRRVYLPGHWEHKWKMNVARIARVLGPYVDMWQLENELNHPWHNPLAFVNKGLGLNAVKIGAEALRSVDPKKKVAVNLFFRREIRFPVPGLFFPHDKGYIRKFKKELKDKIDVLGMDIYRGSWHPGSPRSYPENLNYYHNRWGGNVMIMETGFCTGPSGDREIEQAEYVRKVFRSLDNHIRKASWFSGIVWYEYHSNHFRIPCESYFGLHMGDGVAEKLAWREYVRQVNKYKKYNKILGITYHY